MSGNSKLHNARREKNDEYYTRYEDIEAEVQHYKDQLIGKWVYCPCDDYRWSNFPKFFKEHFDEYQLKKVTATNYNIGDGDYRWDYDGTTETVTPLEGDGDFRSEECTRIKDECDIVISNPPFSLMRAFIDWMKEDGGLKDCLFIGPNNMVTYKNVFPLFRDAILRCGYINNNTMNCTNTDKQVPFSWYTTLAVEPRTLELTKKYDPEKYPKYDNYDAIEVSKVKDIPYDYEGVMGVPITFAKYIGGEFEVKTIACSASWVNYNNELNELNFNKNIRYEGQGGYGVPVLDGKGLYTRLLIKKNFEVVGLWGNFNECDYENGIICGGEIECNYNGKIVKLRDPFINGQTKFKRILIKKNFEVVGMLNNSFWYDGNGLSQSNGKHMTEIGGKKKYVRILIKIKN